MKALLFTASWCKQCTSVKNMVAAYYLPVTIVDVELEVELTDKFEVRSLPTVILTTDMEEVSARFVGTEPCSCALRGLTNIVLESYE